MDAYLLHDSDEFQTGQKRPAVIVCPGGGYLGLSDREAEPVAVRFLAQGYHAFVVHYSVRTLFPAPMLDLGQAILTVRQRAAEWLVKPDQIALCGFSAGGHLAASLGVFWDQPFLFEPLDARPDQLRPNAIILAYPVIDLELIYINRGATGVGPRRVAYDPDMVAGVLGEREPDQALLNQYRLDRLVTPRTPPTFMWHTGQDQIVPVANVLRFADALEAQRVPYELHIFEKGEHGLALADHTTAIGERMVNSEAQMWMPLALNWLRLRRDE